MTKKEVYTNKSGHDFTITQKEPYNHYGKMLVLTLLPEEENLYFADPQEVLDFCRILIGKSNLTFDSDLGIKIIMQSEKV